MKIIKSRGFLSRCLRNNTDQLSLRAHLTPCCQTVFDLLNLGKRVEQAQKRTWAQITITITQRVSPRSCYRTNIWDFFVLKGPCISTLSHGLCLCRPAKKWFRTLNQNVLPSRFIGRVRLIRACFIFYIYTLKFHKYNLSPVESKVMTLRK